LLHNLGNNLVVPTYRGRGTIASAQTAWIHFCIDEFFAYYILRYSANKYLGGHHQIDAIK
jgi:hypothetical protein